MDTGTGLSPWKKHQAQVPAKRLQTTETVVEEKVSWDQKMLLWIRMGPALLVLATPLRPVIQEPGSPNPCGLCKDAELVPWGHGLPGEWHGPGQYLSPLSGAQQHSACSTMAASICKTACRLPCGQLKGGDLGGQAGGREIFRGAAWERVGLVRGNADLAWVAPQLSCTLCPHTKRGSTALWPQLAHLQGQKLLGQPDRQTMQLHSLCFLWEAG